MKPTTSAIVLMLPVALLSGIAGGYLALRTYTPSKEALASLAVSHAASPSDRV